LLVKPKLMSKIVSLALILILANWSSAQVVTNLTNATDEYGDGIGILHTDHEAIYTLALGSKLSLKKFDIRTGELIKSTKLKHSGSASSKTIHYFQGRVLVIPSAMVESQSVYSNVNMFDLNGTALADKDLFEGFFKDIKMSSTHIYLRVSSDGNELGAAIVCKARDGSLHYALRLFDNNFSIIGEHSASLETGTRYFFSNFRFLNDSWVSYEFKRKDGSGISHQFVNLKTGESSGKFPLKLPDGFVLLNYEIRSIGETWELYGICSTAAQELTHKRPFLATFDPLTGVLSDVVIPEIVDHRTTENGFAKNDIEFLEMRAVSMFQNADGGLDFVFLHQSVKKDVMYQTNHPADDPWFKTKGLTQISLDSKGQVVNQIFIGNDYKLDPSTGAIRMTHCGVYGGPESASYKSFIWLKTDEQGLRLDQSEIGKLYLQCVGIGPDGLWEIDLLTEHTGAISPYAPDQLIVSNKMCNDGRSAVPLKIEKEVAFLVIEMK
jgi:hypothetical protein